MMKKRNKPLKSLKVKKPTNKTNKVILNVMLVAIVTFIILTVVFSAYIVTNAPKFDPNNLKFSQMTEIYDNNNNLVAKLGNENRTEITYEELPEILIDAIIATEDARFFQHNGFDLPRFVKASIGQVMGKDAGGASTLTMQIVKNNYTSTVSSGFEGIVRKFTDIYLSIFKVEKKYTKKEIIEFYINDSYLGNGAYGVEQASKNYFGKSVSELNLAEASFIAGLFQSPTYYNPYNYPERAEKRRKTVLYLMERHGYITSEERKIAQAKPITEFVKEKQVKTDYDEYKDYIETVIEELDNEHNLSPYTTPLKIYTALNKDKQTFINKVMSGEAWQWENDLVQAGIVMTESATGEVMAVGAGRNRTTQMSYNYATQINRQIGSTAKPIFAYGPAVEYLGWGTVNYINDAPHSYSDGKKISNSDSGYKGILPMYKALGLSRNITALKAFQTVSKEAGNEKITEFATKLGITPEVSDGRVHEAHSIGSFTGSTAKDKTRTSPMTMAGAYGAFSNGGYYIKPHTIKKLVYKESGEVVETKNLEKYKKTKAMDEATAYIINYSLNWSVTGGLARSAANISGVSVAAKTGTTNFTPQTIKENGLSYNAINDLWVCGYTPTQTITFWYGYNKIYKEHYNTTSSWTTRDRFYKNLAENLFDKTGATFTKPDNVVEAVVEKNTTPLKLASNNTPDEMKEVGYFNRNSKPTEVSTTYDKLPKVTGIKSTVDGKTVKLSWNALTAEDMLSLNTSEDFGTLGYDIYIKDGANGDEIYLGTTTQDTYTHKTSYKNPVFIIYTAFANFKNNKSSGATHSVTIADDFDVKITNETIDVGDLFIDSKPITVIYNSIVVTDDCKIEYTKNSQTVDTNKAGVYKLEYKITYNDSSKVVSRTVTVKSKTSTTVPPTTTTKPTTEIEIN